LLQEGVQGTGAGGAPVHRGQDLNVAAWVETELGGDPAAGHVDGQRGSGFGVFAGEQEEVGQARSVGWFAGVDAVGVDDHPGLGCLPEDLGESYPGHGVGGEEVT